MYKIIIKSLYSFQQFCVVIYLSLLLLPVFAHQNHPRQQQADQMINKLYVDINNQPKTTLSNNIAWISAQFLGRHYLWGALGEGLQGYYDQSPLYRVDAFDCETYVDTVIALALTHNRKQFQQTINQRRYLDWKVSFINRNHFTCLDWNKNNQRQGFLQDITATIKDENNHSPVKYARAVINKPNWYAHMKITQIKLNQVDSSKQQLRLHSLQQEGKRMSSQISVIPYLPLTVLFQPSGKPNQYLFKQIPHAAIIEIIRPNWDLTQKIGTHLNVSHLGFAIWQQGILYFRQASLLEKAVIDIPLIDYLQEAQKSPTIKGINVQIVLSPKKNHHLYD